MKSMNTRDGYWEKMGGHRDTGCICTVYQTILDKGIMPSEKVLDFPVDCNTLTGSVNL